MNVDDRARVYELAERLDIDGPVLTEMLAEPGRATVVLEKAVRARGIRNRAALAVSQWRKPRPRLAAASPEEQAGAELELEPEPPTLSAIEYLWSQDPSPPMLALERLLAAAVDEAGGFAAVASTFRQREHYDADGELVERLTDPST